MAEPQKPNVPKQKGDESKKDWAKRTVERLNKELNKEKNR